VRSFDAAEWKRVREAGRFRFLLRYGFLGRGLPLGVLTALAVSLYNADEASRGQLLQSPSFYVMVLFCVAVFTASGALAANANWVLHERRYGAQAEGEAAEG